jgi:hypothetical protein
MRRPRPGSVCAKGRAHEREAGGERRSRVADVEPQIRAWIPQDTDVPRVEWRDKLAAHGVVINTTAWWPQLQQWQLTRQQPLRASARRRHEPHGQPPNPRWR